MFGKKPAPPAAPAQTPDTRPLGWAMQALTADYVIHGYLPPVDMPLVGFLNVPTQSTFTLLKATVQSLHPQGVSASPAEVTLPKAGLIALLPQDEAGQSAARLQMPNRPAPAVICAGPYLFRLKLMLSGDTPLRNYFGTGAGSLIAAAEAEVLCQMPGARFAALKAPLIILNKALVQLYHPADG